MCEGKLRNGNISTCTSRLHRQWSGTSCATTIDLLIFYIKRIFNGIPPDIIHHPDFTLVKTIHGTASHSHQAPASIIHHRDSTLDCTRTSLSRLILHCLESIARIGRVPVQEKLRKSRFRRIGWREWQNLANHVPRFEGITNAFRRLTSEWLQVREIDTRASNQKHHAEMPSKSMQFNARTFSTKHTGTKRIHKEWEDRRTTCDIAPRTTPST